MTKLSLDCSDCSMSGLQGSPFFFFKFLSLLGWPHISTVSCNHLPITQVLIRSWVFLAHTGEQSCLWIFSNALVHVRSSGRHVLLYLFIWYYLRPFSQEILLKMLNFRITVCFLKCSPMFMITFCLNVWIILVISFKVSSTMRHSSCPSPRERQSGVSTEQWQRKESLVNIVNFHFTHLDTISTIFQAMQF